MGSSAFVDRPVNAFEMESIGTDWCGANYDLPLPAVISMLDQNLGDRDCAAEVCINTYERDGHRFAQFWLYYGVQPHYSC